jgi:hypothetical protein
MSTIYPCTPKTQPDLNFNGIHAFKYAYPVLSSSAIIASSVMLKIGENAALIKAGNEKPWNMEDTLCSAQSSSFPC